MNNPVVHAFFIGRVLAETLSERAEQLVSEGLSNLGRFDAEQRENLRNFTEEVLVKAQQAEAEALSQPPTAASGGSEVPTQDLQATIDNLRAEIAQVRATLQQYRTTAN
ncbi:DUF6825 family protein [Almyronema epifaneia]|uniref:DUF6825 family protein n=1 Tax=Almyronema epifaneia S1 TaxID=2991925 RepID=A0ABW6IH12_9CYAN